MAFLPFISSIEVFERRVIFALPVAYAALIPALPIIIPPVGKSGPFIFSISSSSVQSGFLATSFTPSITSPRLCGGMFVAIPTAMPTEPFTKTFGNLEGKTTGSFNLSSKFDVKSTVSLSMSVSIFTAIFAILASVYRYAAAGSPSIEPKFPCPSTKG